MRNFRIVAVAYEKATPENKKLVRKTAVPVVNKVKVTEKTVTYFDKHNNYDIRRGKGTSAPTKVSDIITFDVFERLKKLESDDSQEKEQHAGIPTGLSDLDAVLGGGFHRSDLIIIGARPAMLAISVMQALCFPKRFSVPLRELALIFLHSVQKDSRV